MMLRPFLAAVLLSSATANAAFDHAHAQWDALLDQHVVTNAAGTASRVRYAGMKADRASRDTGATTRRGHSLRGMPSSLRMRPRRAPGSRPEITGSTS